MVVAVTGIAGAQESFPGSTIESEAPPIPELANCITGIVWYDGNRDGEIDIYTEDPMDGASVTLLEVDPFQYETGPYRLISHRATRDIGNYEFCGLKPGTYEVRVKPPENFVEFIFPIHFLNGSIDLYVWPNKGYVQYFLVPTAGSSPVQIVLEQGEYAEVSVGFGLP